MLRHTAALDQLRLVQIGSGRRTGSSRHRQSLLNSLLLGAMADELGRGSCGCPGLHGSTSRCQLPHGCSCEKHWVSLRLLYIAMCTMVAWFVGMHLYRTSRIKAEDSGSVALLLGASGLLARLTPPVVHTLRADTKVIKHTVLVNVRKLTPASGCQLPRCC